MDKGQRVLITQGERLLLATVAWIGELPKKKGEWVGVIYDEPHGKHNGYASGLSFYFLLE